MDSNGQVDSMNTEQLDNDSAHPDLHLQVVFLCNIALLSTSRMFRTSLLPLYLKCFSTIYEAILLNVTSAEQTTLGFMWHTVSMHIVISVGGHGIATLGLWTYLSAFVTGGKLLLLGDCVSLFPPNQVKNMHALS